MKNKLYIIVALIIIVFVGLFIFSKGTPTSNDGVARLVKAPSFTLQDYSGNEVSLDDFKGKPLVINSWAAWCPFCIEELPDFVQAQKEFGDQVTIIAIDRAESLSVAKKYTDDIGVTNDLIFLLDPSDSFYKSLGGFSMPETIFVDKNGDVIIHKRGPMKFEEIKEKIGEII